MKEFTVVDGLRCYRTTQKTHTQVLNSIIFEQNQIDFIMGLTLVEKILANHSKYSVVKPGDIIDVEIDVRVARDFGGANVVKNIVDHHLGIDDPSKTFFTFDCNPTGSDQKYAANQHLCRLFARDNKITLFDINSGIGTHLMIEKGLVGPGMTAVSTDSHANILGAIGAFGQGMGDVDISLAMGKGKVWFKVPSSVRINLLGTLNPNITAKDIALNLLHVFGANNLLGYAVEISGTIAESLSMEQRITISSMATELGAIIIFFKPDDIVFDYYESVTSKKAIHTQPDADAKYSNEINIDCSSFVERLSLPGNPENTIELAKVMHKKIDSAIIGSCTNGRMEDMRVAAGILRGRKVAPGVVLKIVPATEQVWDNCLKEGLIEIFRDAGAMISNPGCAGCAAGQVGQNGPGEVTLSTGNRNFAGKQGKGEVYLASPAVVAASAIAGLIVSPSAIPDEPGLFSPTGRYSVRQNGKLKPSGASREKSRTIEGRVWYIPVDNIDTDMIFHNRYITITDIEQMGQYTFDNLKNYEDFAKKVKKGDILITGKNFGAGSSRQQAVDCFISLGISCIIAESFGAIYERNAINAALPIVTCANLSTLNTKTGDLVLIDFQTGEIKNLSNNSTIAGNKFSEVQMTIYLNDGIF
jgi:3-isopropylmalate/(R)-2-methylmalate dehydratase large subunit